MKAVEIKKDIYWIGVNDRTTDLFEGIWPITKEGVSYNSYLIKDEKTVLIDMSKAFKTDMFLDQIAAVTDPSTIDYIVINHMEPDHTGVLKILKYIAPNTVIICTEKAKKMLQDYYGIDHNIKVVADGETLNIGKRTLTFVHTPFVHWPETMMTYESSEQILFSCDGFGGYGALNGILFDDECTNLEYYIKESLRYYVNIVAKFTKPVLNAIAKLKDVPVKIICPSHGLVWRNKPGLIIDLYKKWSELGSQAGEAAVTLIYGSMYGNTEQMMNAVAQGIADEGLTVEIFDAARIHASYVLPSLWTKKGVMIGAPTYEGGLFPPVAFMLHEANLKRVMGKKCAMFGSFGWSGGALREIKTLIEPMKWELGDSFEFAGGATEEQLLQGREFGRKFAKSLKD